MKKFALAVAIYLCAASALASRVGNGGFVIRCQGVTKLFEAYQAEQNGQHIAPISGLTLDDKVETLLRRLQTVDPNRAKNFRYQYKNSWYGGGQPLEADGLHLSSDNAADPRLQAQFGLGPVAIPKTCELVLAVQQEMPAVGTNRQGQQKTLFQVQRFAPVWNSLDLDTQASLILHELFYEEYLLRYPDPVNSVGVRHLNGLLSAVEFSSFTVDTWMNELRAAGFSPMFPSFQNPSDSIDLSYAKYAPGTDYVFGRLVYFSGSVVVCGQSLQATNQSMSFLNGLVPSSFFIPAGAIFDFSCYLPKDTLKFRSMNTGTYAISLEKKIEAAGTTVYLPSFSDAYLESYTNRNVKLLGPITAAANWNPVTHHLELTLHKQSFTDIQVQWFGTWQIVNKQCVIDATTGEVLSKD